MPTNITAQEKSADEDLSMLPRDISVEAAPPCKCNTQCPESRESSAWFCPNRLSLSQLFWATGRRVRLAHPGEHTETLEWLVFTCNFNYMYFRSVGRTWVIKRPPPEMVVESDFTADVWQIDDVANPQDIIQNHKKDFTTYRCNPIQIRLLSDGRHQGTTIAYNPDGTTEHVYVPSPVIRHCLGLCPTAGFLRRNRRSRVVNINIPTTADYFTVHYFAR